MTDLNSLINSKNSNLNLPLGVEEFMTLLIRDKVLSSQKKIVFVFNNSDNASKFKDFASNLYFYPGIGADIYSSMNSSTVNLTQRFSIIQKVLQESLSSIVTTHEALNLYVPPPSFFGLSNIVIEKDEIYPIEDLIADLHNIGYKRALSVEEEGDFSQKGEVFDIYPIGHFPIRLNYFDDIIEHIFEIDLSTQKSIRTNSINKLQLASAPGSLFSESCISLFKAKIPRVSYSDQELYASRKEILSSLNNNNFFDDYPLYLSYFFNTPHTLLNYLEDKDYLFINVNDNFTNYSTFCTELQETYDEFTQSHPSFLKPKPEEIYDLKPLVPSTVITLNSPDNDFDINVHSVQKSLLEFDPKFNTSLEYKFISIANFLSDHIKNGYDVSIYYGSDKLFNEINFILESKLESFYFSKIKFIEDKIPTSLIIHDNKEIIISGNLFFNEKSRKTKRSSKDLNSDLFAEQFSTLEIGDFVVHKDHGIGKYLGTETLTFSNSTSDYILLSYKDDDKVYVPVYKMSLLQKHSSSTSHVAVANLKTNKFDQIKSRAKQAIKKLAFDLLELQAKRYLKEGHQFSTPTHDYSEFELSFPYEETPDQKIAIEKVIEDMTSKRPMDRLVCGDVGFGKTEIAMRAAFLAVLDGKQAAVLVPTTVLAYQHYNTFTKRFKDFPVNIEFISRFKTTKQSNEVATNLAEGKIDILIGTHKLLSDKFIFNDLGLLVIDEEQRFGVTHKEKLKLLKENVDSLTLTATPIPRTLHQSFLGIKELSVIKTPPPRRQSIKTYVIKEDAPTLKMAIEKELSRGGQVFVVHNKVNDIENYTAKIRKLVPNSRLVYAHGQMNERELEKIISDFYNYKYDILVSTTIIESGIDIPRANTMIIDQANNYGLSQLHQLRGRIGRSDKKAYAYLVIPTQKKLTDVAAKRLRAIQTYAELGSGFSLASTDLEIRGSGDVLGPEQSGHINSIGLELYTELLKEAISELKGTTAEVHEEIEISTPYNSFIPSTYIEASNLRLKYYKILSNSYNLSQLEDNASLITDQFGQPPEEFKNLISIIKSRILLSGIALKSIKVKSYSITLQFNRSRLDENTSLRDKILNFFSQRPKIYKLNPDYSINCKFKDTILIDTLLEFSEFISKEFSKD